VIEKLLLYNFRCAGYFLKKGVRRNDVIHLFTGGDHFELAFIALGAMYLGTVPAFSDAAISDEALLIQVDFNCSKATVRFTELGKIN
jgi:hypothetical protein